MSYACGPADWIDLAVGRLEDAKRSLRECDRLRQGCDICEELRQARRCLNKALIMVAEEREIVKEWSENHEGREISLDTEVLFDANDRKVRVTSYRYRHDVFGHSSVWKVFSPHGCFGVDELTFRQMVDGDFTPDGTLRDYLLDGHSEGRWHYTEQGDYNRYIVNDRVFDRFKDIALAYSR